MDEERKNIHVLILDPDPSIAISLAKELEGIYGSVNTIRSVSELRDNLNNKRVDLIIAELRTPELDGEQLLLLIKQLGSSTSVIFISQNTDVRTAVRLIQMGGADFLLKPIKAEVLQESAENTIRSLIFQRKLKATNIALRKRDEQFKSSFRNAPEGIFIAELSGKYIDANPMFCQLLGYEKSKLLELDCFDTLFQGKQRHIVVWEFARLLIGQVLSFEEKLRNANDDLVVLEIFTSLISRDRFHGFVRDITKSKKELETLRKKNVILETNLQNKQVEIYNNQERYRGLLDNFPEGIVTLLDKKYRYIATGGNAYKFLNMEPTKLIGKNLFEIWPVHIANLLEAQCRLAFEGKKQKVEFEFQGRSWLTYIVVSSRNDQFENMIIMDITERKKTEEINKKNLLQEQGISRFKTQIINIVAHEMRTPLTSLAISTALLRDSERLPSFSADKREKHFKTIEDSIKDLEEITENVNIINKGENNRLIPDLEKLNLFEFCKSIVEKFAQIHSSYTIDFRNSVEENRIFLLDPKLLKKILENLLSNAIKYSPKNKRIELKVRIVGDMIELEIKDKGIGIPKEDQGKLLDSFFRARNTKDFPGQGLGLNIVKYSLEALNGEVEFESELDKGTTFIVKIKINEP